MAHETFVVQISGTDMYLIGYNIENPPGSIFGNLESAIEYSTQDDADAIAEKIGGGTVGTPKP